jgi:transcriptional regulator GlxA family with amidase domain
MRIAILAPPGVQSLDVVGPAEVFWEAARRMGDPSAYEVQLIGTTDGPVSGTGSLRFLCDRTIHDPDEPIDTLLVAGDPSFSDIDPAVITWLQRRIPTVRRYGSICTGVFLLAAAGVLDGERVTTHWECADKLRTDYPNLLVDSDKIFIQSGALSTAAGVSSGMDLALAMVEEDYGRQVALIVARYMVMFLKRPGGQSQFSSFLAAQMSGRSAIQKVQEYILQNLANPISVEDMALEAGMSSRNFSRLFAQELKTTPAEFVEAARLDAARNLLEETGLHLQQVAFRSGFGTPDRMRRAFLRNLGVNPLDYRKRFQTALGDVFRSPPVSVIGSAPGRN